VALLSIKFLLAFVRTNTFILFRIYRILATLAFALLVTNPGCRPGGQGDWGSYMPLAVHLFGWCLLAIALSPCAQGAESKAAAQAERLVFVSVAGAPGDGEEALAAALTRRLAAVGLKPATAFQGEVYEVQGTVRLAPSARGKQSVSIVWVVLAPDGTQLGIVRQTKEIRAGSLDKKWSGAAEAAAAAAFDQVRALLPR
jgi:hypothetical protein